MRKFRKLLNDWVLIKVDPLPKENVTLGGILLTEPHMARTGVVLFFGQGKRYHDGPYRKVDLSVGDHVAFFAGNMDTKQGKAIQAYIEEDEALLPETAVLFAFTLEEGEPLPRVTK